HDDELDVRARRMVPCVETHHRPLAERGDLDEGRPPVRDVGVVERGLEELVLEDQPLMRPEAGVDLLQRLLQSVLAAAHVGLTWIVRPFSEPDLQVAAAGLVHHVDAAEVVVDRLAADPFLLMRESTEAVVVVLERVGVDRAERDPQLLGMPAEVREVVHHVPRDVEGHE
ncbi:hypothetical protein ABE10_02250, partial [Bacillus toyonensis]|nr:hypothetical protein [Bacillus toyonensis]